MYPQISIRFDPELRKDTSLLLTPPQHFDKPFPALNGGAYAGENAEAIIQTLPSFGIQFGYVQVDCRKALHGKWYVHQPCTLVMYGIAGNGQIGVEEYGDGIGAYAGRQSAMSIPDGIHLFLANPGMHRFYYVALSPGMMDVLLAEMPNLDRLTGIYEFDKPETWTDFSYSQQDRNILERICRNQYRYLDRHQFLQKQVYQLMKLYAQRIDRWGDNPDEQHSNPCRKAADYIREHFHDPEISLATIADAIHISVAGLQKACARDGFKPLAFITFIRMHTAEDLLRTTVLPVSEIAAQVGYYDKSHFSTLFKKFKGKSPTEFRNGLPKKLPEA